MKAQFTNNSVSGVHRAYRGFTFDLPGRTSKEIEVPAQYADNLTQYLEKNCPYVECAIFKSEENSKELTVGTYSDETLNGISPLGSLDDQTGSGSSGTSDDGSGTGLSNGPEGSEGGGSGEGENGSTGDDNSGNTPETGKENAPDGVKKNKAQGKGKNNGKK
jgi:hypothetical protein